MKIKDPKFELYEFVILHWNGDSLQDGKAERSTKIVSRWYCTDDDCWWYKVGEDDQLYPESAFSPRTE